MKKETIEQRTKRIQANIDEAIEFFELEVNARRFVRELIVGKYMPLKEEFKSIVFAEIREQAKQTSILSAAIEETVRDEVRKRIEDLSEEYKKEIKDDIRYTLDEYI